MTLQKGDAVRCVKDTSTKGFRYNGQSRIGWTGTVIGGGFLIPFKEQDQSDEEVLVQLDSAYVTLAQAEYEHSTGQNYFRASMLEKIDA